MRESRFSRGLSAWLVFVQGFAYAVHRLPAFNVICGSTLGTCFSQHFRQFAVQLLAHDQPILLASVLQAFTRADLASLK